MRGGAGDQEVVAGAAADPVGPLAADQQVAVVAAGQHVVPRAAHQDVEAPGTGEAVVAGTPVPQGRQGDGAVGGEDVVTLLPVGDEVAGGPVGALHDAVDVDPD